MKLWIAAITVIVVSIALWMSINASEGNNVLDYLQTRQTSSDAIRESLPEHDSKGANLNGADAIGSVSMSQPAHARGVEGVVRTAKWLRPKQLSIENERRLDQYAEQLAASDSPMSAYVQDLQDRLTAEERDAAWQLKIEDGIERSFPANASMIANMEVATPKCSRTVCVFRAVGTPNGNTNSPGANWQQYVNTVFGQEWWRNELGNMTTSMSFVDGRIVYITYAQRK